MCIHTGTHVGTCKDIVLNIATAIHKLRARIVGRTMRWGVDFQEEAEGGKGKISFIILSRSHICGLCTLRAMDMRPRAPHMPHIEKLLSIYIRSNAKALSKKQVCGNKIV